jgi:hypothetical protein
MDLKKAIGRQRTKSHVNKIVSYIADDPKRFKELVKIFMEGPLRVTQKVSSPLTSCVQNHPELIYPWLKAILALLKKPEATNTLKRNTVRLLQYVEIPGKYWGDVSNLCLHYLTDKKEAIAVRVFSMTVLLNLSKNIPEIKRELKIIIEDQLPFGSPAFSSRAKKVLKVLNEK